MSALLREIAQQAHAEFVALLRMELNTGDVTVLEGGVKRRPEVRSHEYSVGDVATHVIGVHEIEA